MDKELEDVKKILKGITKSREVGISPDTRKKLEVLALEVVRKGNNAFVSKSKYGNSITVSLRKDNIELTFSVSEVEANSTTTKITETI